MSNTNNKRKIYAILLSGGIGTRIGGDIPKQYIEIGPEKQTVFYYSIKPLLESEIVDAIQIVADEAWIEKINETVSGKEIGFSSPGTTRQLSIYNALVDLKDKLQAEDIVIIHDAARPNLTVVMLEAYIAAMFGGSVDEEMNLAHDGVIPVLPMKDTVYLSEDGMHVSELVDRTQIYAGQAPELFVYGKYLEANEALIDVYPADNPTNPIMKINGSTEPAVMSGMDILMVRGDEKNIKITSKDDLEKIKLEYGGI